MHFENAKSLPLSRQALSLCSEIGIRDLHTKSRWDVTQTDPYSFEWTVPIGGYTWRFMAYNTDDVYERDKQALTIYFRTEEKGYEKVPLSQNDVLKVFSAAMAFTRKALQRYRGEVDILAFSASGRSRQKLYDRFISRLLRNYPGSQIEIKWDLGGAEKVYRIHLPSSSFKESSELRKRTRSFCNKIRQKTPLCELLSSAKPKLQKDIGHTYFWEVELFPGQVYRFSALLGVDEKNRIEAEILFSASQDGDRYTSKRIEVGGKKALRVFGAAASFAKEVLRVLRPQVLTFRAHVDEPERIPLYKKLAVKLGREWHAKQVTGRKEFDSYVLSVVKY